MEHCADKKDIRLGRTLKIGIVSVMILAFALMFVLSLAMKTRADTDVSPQPTAVLAAESSPAPTALPRVSLTPNPNADSFTADPTAPPQDAQEQTPKPTEEEFVTEEPTASPTGGDWGKYPPAGQIDEQPFQKGNLLVAAQMRVLKMQTTARIAELAAAVGADNAGLPNGWESWFTQVLALYAVENACAGDFPYGVRIESLNNTAELNALYWELTRVAVFDGPAGYEISIECKDIFYVARQRGLSAAKMKELTGLLNAKNTKLVAAMPKESILSVMGDEEFETALRTIPTEISGRRQAVLLAALSLKGRVSYFWAGKSTVYGWDNRWGRILIVDREGNGSYGKAKPFGMDCSGYVAWCFVNASSTQDIVPLVGKGTANLWDKSKPILWEELRPGDFIFRQTPSDEGINHIGIVVAKTEAGVWLVAQCGYDGHGVVLVPLKNGEFHYAKRPVWYGD